MPKEDSSLLDLSNWWPITLSFAAKVSSLHGKNSGIYRLENAWWICAKRGICSHLLVFTYWKSKIFQLFCWVWIRVFVPLSRSFPLRWMPFSEIYRSVNTWQKCLVCLCSRMFFRFETSRSSGVNNWKPAFSFVFQNCKCCDISQNALFSRIHRSVNVQSASRWSQKFSPVFLHFPKRQIQDNSRKRVLSGVHCSAIAQKLLCSCVFRSFLVLFLHFP